MNEFKQMLRLTCTVLLACLTFILVYTDNMHIAQVMHSQREGMGLLEYQAMPSLRDVAHDGVVCTIRNTGQVARSVRVDGMDHPSRTKSHPAGSLSSRQSGGPSCWAIPLAFGLILHSTC